ATRGRSRIPWGQLPREQLEDHPLEGRLTLWIPEPLLKPLALLRAEAPGKVSHERVHAPALDICRQGEGWVDGAVRCNLPAAANRLRDHEVLPEPVGEGNRSCTRYALKLPTGEASEQFLH